MEKATIRARAVAGSATGDPVAVRAGDGGHGQLTAPSFHEASGQPRIASRHVTKKRAPRATSTSAVGKLETRPGPVYPTLQRLEDESLARRAGTGGSAGVRAHRRARGMARPQPAGRSCLGVRADTEDIPVAHLLVRVINDGAHIEKRGLLRRAASVNGCTES